MSEFIRYLCYNRPVKGKDGYECRGGRIGGPSLETLNSHDFGTAPFVDIRYCQKCKAYLRITINSMTELPVIEVLTPEEYSKLPHKSIDEVFGGCIVEGRKVVFNNDEGQA